MSAPEAYEGFEGRVGRTVAGSDPWWPPRVEAPDGAPNVLVILIDDLGYSDLGCYGGEIRTPNVDALAARGVRYTNFHVTPMCSPTRSALLTGLNSHRAGVGHVAHSDPGFPGYAMELTEHAATAAEIYRDAGWATFMAGKWHLAKDSDLNAAGAQHSWPCQRGFERFYGILDGFTNLHHPHRLMSDNQVVEVDRYPDGYYLTDDLTDRCLTWWKELRASHPRKPWFTYLAHPACHAPLHAKAEDIERYRGRYEAGWDALRAERFARQQDLGIVTEGTAVAPRNTEEGDDVRPWDDLGDHEKALFARHMEVYAGMVDSVDQNLGRLVSLLEELGELDNTIVMVISDNGASSEGGVSGAFNEMSSFNNRWETLEEVLPRIDELGGTSAYNHYPWGWSWAGNTPFRRWKKEVYRGGATDPFVVSWPAGIDARGEIRTQYAHAIDMVPTVLAAVGMEAPAVVKGVTQTPLEGVSFKHTFDDPAVPTLHHTQYFEMFGQRAIDHDGWRAVCGWPGSSYAEGAALGRKLGDDIPPETLDELDASGWQLFRVADDPAEGRDPSDQHPEKLRAMIAR